MAWGGTALTGCGLSCLLHKEWKKGIAALTGVLIGNLINIQVGNRMVFMTAFVAAVICLGMFFIMNRKNRRAIRIAIGVIGAALLPLACFAI